VALTGVAAPVAPLAGIVAGVIAWGQDYKGECVDGAVQIAVLKGSAPAPSPERLITAGSFERHAN